MYFVIGGFVCIHLVVLAVWEMTSPHVPTVRFDTNEVRAKILTEQIVCPHKMYTQHKFSNLSHSCFLFAAST